MKSTRKNISQQRTASPKPVRKTLRIDQISLAGDTQPRAELDHEVIAEYKDRYLAGVELPPVDVFSDGATYWLADGFHRRWAAHEAGAETIKCIVHTGTLEDARWYSYAVNQTHGLRRSRGDKEKAVTSALRHRKGRRMSDRRIAEHVGVSHTFVAKVRAALQSTGNVASETKREGKDGRVIETAAIGKPKANKSEPDLRVYTEREGERDPGDAAPCPNCGCRARNEDGDCVKCLDPCENGVQDHVDDEVEVADLPAGFEPVPGRCLMGHAVGFDGRVGRNVWVAESVKNPGYWHIIMMEWRRPAPPELHGSEEQQGLTRPVIARMMPRALKMLFDSERLRLEDFTWEIQDGQSNDALRGICEEEAAGLYREKNLHWLGAAK